MYSFSFSPVESLRKWLERSDQLIGNEDIKQRYGFVNNVKNEAKAIKERDHD